MDVCVWSVTQGARLRDIRRSRLIAVKGKFYIGFWVKRRDFTCRRGARRILGTINMRQSLCVRRYINGPVRERTEPRQVKGKSGYGSKRRKE